MGHTQKPIPVLIVYFTAWVDKSGVLNFRKDIYGHDEQLAAKLSLNNYFLTRYICKKLAHAID